MSSPWALVESPSVIAVVISCVIFSHCYPPIFQDRVFTRPCTSSGREGFLNKTSHIMLLPTQIRPKWVLPWGICGLELAKERCFLSVDLCSQSRGFSSTWQSLSMMERMDWWGSVSVFSFSDWTPGAAPDPLLPKPGCLVIFSFDSLIFIPDSHPKHIDF